MIHLIPVNRLNQPGPHEHFMRFRINKLVEKVYACAECWNYETVEAPRPPAPVRASGHLFTSAPSKVNKGVKKPKTRIPTLAEL